MALKGGSQNQSKTLGQPLSSKAPEGPSHAQPSLSPIRCAPALRPPCPLAGLQAGPASCTLFPLPGTLNRVSPQVSAPVSLSQRASLSTLREPPGPCPPPVFSEALLPLMVILFAH